jgi:large subunit ribosomal protein L35
MPKMKTKSSAKKRFRMTASGRVRGSFAFKQHNLRKRSKKMKRQNRGTRMLGKADSRIIKSYMPYSRSN